MTKVEIKERKNSEISAQNDDIKPQNYLNKSKKGSLIGVLRSF